MIRWVFLIAMVLPICLGQMAGGFGPDRAPTEDEASILGGAVQQYLLTQGQNSAEPVRIIRVSAQVVSGTNYCVEVRAS